jgi:hypothetical protein
MCTISWNFASRTDFDGTFEGCCNGSSLFIGHTWETLTLSYPSPLKTCLTFQRLLKGLCWLLKYEIVKHIGDFYPVQVCIKLNPEILTEVAEKPAQIRQTEGWTWFGLENRTKNSRMINYDLCLLFSLFFILWVLPLSDVPNPTHSSLYYLSIKIYPLPFGFTNLSLAPPISPPFPSWPNHKGLIMGIFSLGWGGGGLTAGQVCYIIPAVFRRVERGLI